MYYMEIMEMWEKMTIRIDGEVLKRLRVVAAVLNISQGDLIQRLLTSSESLESLEKEHKISWK